MQFKSVIPLLLSLAFSVSATPSNETAVHTAVHNSTVNHTVLIEKRQWRFNPVYGPLNPLTVQADVQNLRAAIAGLGTDERSLTTILANRTPDQVLQLKMTWNKFYGSHMEQAIKEDTSGHYEDIILSLCWTKYEFEAKWLHWAMHGVTVSDDALTEILILKNNRELEAIKYTYMQLYNKDVVLDIADHTSLWQQRFFVTLFKGRDNVGAFNLESDVNALYRAGSGMKMILADPQTFMNIILNRPVGYLRHVFTLFFQKFRFPIEEMIRKRFIWNTKIALLRAIRSINDPIGYIADEFEDSMLGPGTRDTKLLRLLVRHFRINRYHGLDYRALVKDAYMRQYKRNLYDRIFHDTNLIWERDYQNALSAVYMAW